MKDDDLREATILLHDAFTFIDNSEFVAGQDVCVAGCGAYIGNERHRKACGFAHTMNRYKLFCKDNE